MAKSVLLLAVALAAVCGAHAAAEKSVFNWQNVTSSVLWIPQVGLDCRATCVASFMQPVNAYKPTNADPAPPLLCAHIGALVNGGYAERTPAASRLASAVLWTRHLCLTLSLVVCCRPHPLCARLSEQGPLQVLPE